MMSYWHHVFSWQEYKSNLQKWFTVACSSILLNSSPDSTWQPVSCPILASINPTKICYMLPPSWVSVYVCVCVCICVCDCLSVCVWEREDAHTNTCQHALSLYLPCPAHRLCIFTERKGKKIHFSSSLITASSTFIRNKVGKFGCVIVCTQTNIHFVFLLTFFFCP